jgi:uncharacterized protein (TIGR00369 family)
MDADALVAMMPLAGTLGIEAVSATQEEVRLRMPWRAEICTTNGILHGGALMALADSAGAACAVLNLPEGASTSTIESKTNFLRTVRQGAVTAVSRPLHAGRTVIVVQTDLLDDEGRRVAQTTQTQAVLITR